MKRTEKNCHQNGRRITVVKVFCVVCILRSLKQSSSITFLLLVLRRCWLGDRKGVRPVKNFSGGVLAWLSVWSECVCVKQSSSEEADHDSAVILS